MTTLSELLARVKAATGPDRGLDCDIWCELFAPDAMVIDHAARFTPYTASIDAALALVKKLLPGWTVVLTWQPCLNPPEAFCELGGRRPSVGAVTEALALLAALLTALEAKHE